MRAALGWMAVLSVGLLAACAGGQDRENARAVALERDLTLQTATVPVTQVASPVELGRPEPPRRTAPSRKASPKPAPAPAPRPEPEAAPAPEPIAAPAPASVAVEPAPAAAPTGRELAPGQTVTVLPASAGGSTTGPEDVYLPDGPGFGIKEGGGHCPNPPRRGRPIGIVGFR